MSPHGDGSREKEVGEKGGAVALAELRELYDAPRALPRPEPPEGEWAPESDENPYVDGMPLMAWVSWTLESAGVCEEDAVAGLIVEAVVVARTGIAGRDTREYLAFAAQSAAFSYAILARSIRALPETPKESTP